MFTATNYDKNFTSLYHNVFYITQFSPIFIKLIIAQLMQIQTELFFVKLHGSTSFQRDAVIVNTLYLYLVSFYWFVCKTIWPFWMVIFVKYNEIFLALFKQSTWANNDMYVTKRFFIRYQYFAKQCTQELFWYMLLLELNTKPCLINEKR